MAKMNWDKYKYIGVAYTKERSTAMKMQRRDRVRATEKQIAFLKKLGVQIPKHLSKTQASGLIDKRLSAKN